MIEEIYTTCIECGGTQLVPSSGYIVCIDCGITADRTYSDTAVHNINFVENKQLQTYIGKSSTFIGSLGSQIGYSSGKLSGPRGKPLPNRVINRYQRLIRFHHDRAKYDGNATHLRTILAFNRVINSLQLGSDIKNRSLYLYWKHIKTGKQFTNHVLLVALCLLQAVREGGFKAPIQFSEIISTFAANGHRVTNKNLLRLARELGINLAPTRRQSEDYIERIASAVRQDPEVLERLQRFHLPADRYEAILILVTRHFLEQLDHTVRGGTQPFPFAVTIMYLVDRAIGKAMHKRPILTQSLMAKAVDSAEYTIRDHVYRVLGKVYDQYEPFLVEEITSHLNL